MMWSALFANGKKNDQVESNGLEYRPAIQEDVDESGDEDEQVEVKQGRSKQYGGP